MALGSVNLKGHKLERLQEIEFNKLERDYPKNGEAIMNSEDKVHYSSSNYSEWLREKFLKSKYEQGVSIFKTVDEPIWVRAPKIAALREEIVTKFKMVCSTDYYMNFSNDWAFLTLEMAGTEVDHVKVFSSDQTTANAIMEVVRKHACNESKLALHWIYSPDGRGVDIIEECNEVVTADLYPFIKDFDTYISRFIESRSNILILKGDPGTGKTSLIRQIILALGKEAHITYDASVLSNDVSFAHYMCNDDAGAFIIEDADMLLDSRSEGNSMVSRFLNVGDGLIRLKNKKLIFSTNLKNLNDIDSALIRPGRCFDITEFRALTRAEAEVAAKSRNIILPAGKQNFTLAEIFNSPVAAPTGRKVGFT